MGALGGRDTAERGEEEEWKLDGAGAVFGGADTDDVFEGLDGDLSAGGFSAGGFFNNGDDGGGVFVGDDDFYFEALPARMRWAAFGN